MLKSLFSTKTADIQEGKKTHFPVVLDLIALVTLLLLWKRLSDQENTQTKFKSLAKSGCNKVASVCCFISIEKKVANDEKQDFPPLFLNKNNRETMQYGYVLHWLGVWDTFPNCDPTFGFWHRTLDCVWVPDALYPRLLSHLNVSDQRESEELKRSHDKREADARSKQSKLNCHHQTTLW